MDQFSRVARGVTEGARFGETPRFWSGGNKAELRDFTAGALAAGLAPDQVAAMLNVYLDKMVEILLDHGGTIDGFTGDGILGLFGAPDAGADDPQRAVACALAMQFAMPEVNLLNREFGPARMEMGVGIHTGDVVLGNIGTSARAKYGALGSAVSLTARIEACTFGGEVMISHATLAAVRERVETGARRQVVANGTDAPIAVYPVLGLKGRPELAPSRAAAPTDVAPTVSGV